VIPADWNGDAGVDPARVPMVEGRPEPENACILNVDDTPAARYAKTRILERAGWRVIEATNAAEALVRARRDRPDVIVLDVRLPDRSGIDVCRDLKADPGTAAIMVLQTSATFTDTASRVRGLEGGADHYLAQPFAPEELIASTRALLRLAAADAARRQAIARANDAADALAARGERLALLSATAADLLLPGDFQVVLKRLFDRIAGPLALDVFFHYSVEGDALVLAASGGLSASGVTAMRHLAYGQAVCGLVARDRRVTVLDDVAEADPEQTAGLRGEGVRAYACTPLMAGDRLLGTLGFGRRTARPFTHDDLELIATLCHYVAIAKERERVESERALWADAFRYCAHGISISDPRTDTIVVANPAYAAMHGYTPGSLFGKPIQAMLADEAAAGQRARAEALDRGESLHAEVLHRRRDGSVFPAEMHAVSVRDAEGRTLYRVASMQDVTERVRTRQALAESDRRKDEFLAMLAHELRNPLAPITSALAVIRQLYPDAEPLERWRSMIDRQVRQLTRLVDDLLDVSRITLGKVTLRLEAVDLADAVRTALESVRTLVDTQRHHLEVMLPPRQVTLRADRTRLAQVLANLLNNAAKYTPPGGRIALVADVVPGEDDGDAAWLDLRVIDSGIGMAPEVLDTVFELFTQADHSLDRAQGGLGVGLALARRLAELHGGTLEAASAGPGQGSTFRLRLPLAEGEGSVTRVPRRDAGRADGRRVFIVEDNADAAEALRAWLELAGHVVAVAHDGREALTRLPAFAPDVALLDLGVPGMDGYALAERLRALPATAQTMLIALSGHAQPEDRQHSRAAGFDAHLVKPVDMDALGRMLAREREGASTTSGTTSSRG
jgi:PAS domain S-box-containing protein